MYKRILAVILVVVFALSALPVTAYATEGSYGSFISGQLDDGIHSESVMVDDGFILSDNFIVEYDSIEYDLSEPDPIELEPFEYDLTEYDLTDIELDSIVVFGYILLDCDDDDSDEQVLTFLCLFNGEYWYLETHKGYLRHRYYDPRIGRFSQEDPIRDGLNWYTYTSNNPIFYVDPSGLAQVNIVDYAKSMGAYIYNYTNKDGRECVAITANGVTQSYVMNNGNIKDNILNDKFGWESVLSQEERDKGWIIQYNKGKAYGVPSPQSQGNNIKTVQDSIVLGVALGTIAYAAAPAVAAAAKSVVGSIAAKIAVATAPAAPAATKAGEKIYYHVTTAKNAAEIVRTGTLYPGEFGKIYALNHLPSAADMANLGAHGSTVVQFTSQTTRFVADYTTSVAGALMTEINNLSLQIYNAVIVNLLN